MTQSKTARELAYLILFEFEKTRARIDILESKNFKNTTISQQDRRFAKQLYSGAIRRLAYLDWIISRLYHGRFSKLLDKIKTVLRLGLYELIYLNQPPYATVNEYVSIIRKKINPKQGALVNAVLRNFLRAPNDHNPDKEIKDINKLLSIKYSFPLWMIDRWVKLWGQEKTTKLCAGFDTEPDFTVHFNQNKIDNLQFEKLLQDQNISFKKSALFDTAYRINDMQKLIQSGMLDKGMCSIQDESACIPVELFEIQRGDKILDMCAAPGGKFIQILQMNKTSMAVAVDNQKSRLLKVRDNMQRMNLSNGELVVADSRQLPFKEAFDKILLDAPCSGLGVIKKHPDIKWRRSEAEIQSFSNLQNELIEESINYLKEGGKLVYSTCTIDPQENEIVTNNFFENHKNEIAHLQPTERFAILKKSNNIRTFPDEHHMDGSYCTIFKKY